jgi:hypothetical protein
MKYVIIGIIVVIALLVWVLNRRGSGGLSQGSPDAAPGHQHQQLPRDGGIGGGGV